MLLAAIPSSLADERFDIRPVSDAEGIDGYVNAEIEEAARHEKHHDGDVQLATAVLALPGIQLFVGYLDGKAVARSMLVMSGAMAGINNVYVAPSLRKQGWGWAITEAAISAGRMLGATAACLNASRMGKPLYERMGFREVYRYLNFVKAAG